MKNKKIFLPLLLLISLTSCDISNIQGFLSELINGTSENNSELESQDESIKDIDTGALEYVDYVSKTHLDLNDSTKIYQEVTVYNFVDGDTTHFKPKGTTTKWINEKDGVLKARYNSVDTPESTGKVEPWGKAASKHTKETLSNAKSIILQSDDTNWNTDSTGGRYLVWVWYNTAADSTYRLLNLELIQEGLAKLKSASSYSLYETFSAANLQAMTLKLKVYSDENDPDYYYGVAQNVTMKEIRTNTEDYSNVKVAVEGLITVYSPSSHMVYAEAYDGEDDRSYGMNFYLGFNSYNIIKVGNIVRFVGTLQYYETGESWQVSGLSYLPLEPDYEGSMKLISKNNEVTPKEITASDLSSTEGALNESTYVTYKNLTVNSVYTTSSENVSSNGAMTLTCKDSNNNTVIIRTSVLKVSDDTLLCENDVLGKTIDATGIVCKYDGNYQIHVYSLNDLVIA